MDDLKICVAGAGVIGLSTALYLAQICETKHSPEIGTILLLTRNQIPLTLQIADYIPTPFATSWPDCRHWFILKSQSSLQSHS